MLNSSPSRAAPLPAERPVLYYGGCCARFDRDLSPCYCENCLMPLFEASIPISRPPGAVFEFLLRPANAVAVTPPETQLTLIEAPDVLYEGCRIEFEIRAYGQTQRFVHEVVELESPRRFLEVQREGLFREFRHEHVVLPDGDEAVLLVDRVQFEPPGGLLGFLLTEHRIREMLGGSFEHRHREIKRLLEQAGT